MVPIPEGFEKLRDYFEGYDLDLEELIVCLRNYLALPVNQVKGDDFQAFTFRETVENFLYILEDESGED